MMQDSARRRAKALSSANTLSASEAHLASCSREARLDHLSPDVVSYNVVLSACAKDARLWERALDLLCNMEENGVDPDLISYSTAVSSCEHAGELASAKQVYRFANRRGFFEHWNALSVGAIDLHTLPAAVAKVALAVALDDVAYRLLHAPAGGFDLDCLATSGVDPPCPRSNEEEFALSATNVVLCDLPLDVITGRGLHSANRTAVLRPQIEEFLNSRPEYAKLKIGEAPRNSGMLRITAASLYEWATCKHATAEAKRNAKIAALDSLTSCCIADDSRGA